MDVIRFLQRSGVAVAVAALTGCSSGGSSSGEATGSLTLMLTDAPVHDVAELWVEFDGVTLRRAGGPPIHISFDDPIRENLLALTPDSAAVLLNGEEVPAGTYTQLALHVNAEHDGVYDSVAVLNGGGEVELFVPSGAQTGLKLIDHFTITANQDTSFMIDWDARMGLVIDPPGLSGYILRPTLRILDMTDYGTLNGTVTMGLIIGASCTNDLNLDTGNAVYIYDGFGAVPDDIGGAGDTPVATATVRQENNGDYTYETILSPGEYTVAFTCQAGDDHPEEDNDIEFAEPVNVEVVADETSTANFQ
jgi:hypothetical protein